MAIVLAGLNHRTTPVELRERFCLSDYGLRTALLHLAGSPGSPLSEVAILSTCNRLEVLAVADDESDAVDTICDWIRSLHPLPDDYLYTRRNEEAVFHLMRVACGLDSLILGEAQILGQVAEALAQAQAAGTTGPILSHLFSQAIHAGKQARAQTDIGRHTVSVSHAAARLIRQQLGDLSGRSGVIVGAGEMAALAARALQAQGATNLTIISRTHDHAASLARQLGVGVARWADLPEAMAKADVVITATGAPHSILHARDIELTMTRRGNRSLLLVDIAVPRDIDEDAALIPAVTLFDIDDLHAVVDQNRAQRQAAVAEVEAIVAEGVGAFLRWLQSRQVVPVIVDLRRKAEALVEAEIEQTLRRLPDLDPREQDIVVQLGRRIVNKLLHEPTTILKERAGSPEGSDYAEAIRALFALEADDPIAMEQSPHG